MSRKLRVTLEITVEDLPKAERLELAQGLCFEDGDTPKKLERQLERVKDYSPDQVADVLPVIGAPHMQGEMFEGSEIFARFTVVDVKAAEWAT